MTNMAYVGHGPSGIGAELVFVKRRVKWFGAPAVQKKLSTMASAAIVGSSPDVTVAPVGPGGPCGPGETIAFTQAIGVGATGTTRV
jgi:hypothetical protein